MEDRTEERNEEMEKSCPDAADVVLNVILNNPEEFERNEPPMAIQSNFMCTFNLETVPMERAKADGNGAYIQTGCPKKFYHVSNKGGWSCKAAKSGESGYYINNRVGRKYEKIPVPPSEVYLLTRVYRQNKNNPSFLQMIAIARRGDHKEPNPYYYMSYRWNDCDNNSDREFIISRHGNAKKPHAPIYARQNPATKRRATC